MENLSHKKEIWLAENKCTGCAACENVCPKNALKIELGSSGHLVPIAYEGCIECGKCEAVCHERLTRPSNEFQPRIFAVWSKDSKIRFESTSGGAFTELASIVLANNGLVFGATYDEGCTVRHESVDSNKDLARLRQSKYVQSNIGLIFRVIQKELDSRRSVLFCGAPCQVSALRAFLGKEYDTLYLVDFICMGVNSPKAYIAWLEQLAHKEGSEVERVWFKYKKGGWKSSPRRTRIDFANGKILVQDGRDNYFMNGYLDSRLFLRQSCTDCEFKGFPRYGDLTVADFWGVAAQVDDDKGTSMVMINNEKGEKLFQNACCNMVVEERPFDEIFSKNACINESAEFNPKAQLFLNELETLGFDAAYKKYSESMAKRKIKSIIKKMRSYLKK